jgi:hypothetical protein
MYSWIKLGTLAKGGVKVPMTKHEEEAGFASDYMCDRLNPKDRVT